MIFSGLRRADGSIVEGTTGSFNTTVNNQSMIRRPSINNINMGPTFRQEGDMGRYVAFNDPGQPGAGFSNYQDYLDAGNSPVTGPIRGPLLGGAMIPEQGPLGPGLIGGIPSARNPGKPGGVQVPNVTGIQTLPGSFPIPNIPSVNSNNTQGIGSFFNNENQQNNFSYINNNNNNNQDFGQYLNSYINNSINQRMQSIFKGIMSLFQ